MYSIKEMRTTLPTYLPPSWQAWSQLRRLVVLHAQLSCPRLNKMRHFLHSDSCVCVISNIHVLSYAVTCWAYHTMKDCMMSFKNAGSEINFFWAGTNWWPIFFSITEWKSVVAKCQWNCSFTAKQMQSFSVWKYSYTKTITTRVRFHM